MPKGYRAVALSMAAAVLAAFTSCAASIGMMDTGPDGVAQTPVHGQAAAISNEKLEGHTLCAKNERFSLYLEEDSLSVIIKENSTDRLMRSTVSEPAENDQALWKNFMQSGVVMEYYAGQSTNSSRADMVTKNPVKTVTRIKDGFSARVRYEELGISFDVVVTLAGTGIKAEVPQATIEETNDNRIAALYLYPFMGHTRPGETAGYMFIPDGCGALIDLKDNRGQYNQPYVSKMYGKDYGVDEVNRNDQLFDGEISMYRAPGITTAPVFGMVHTEREIGFLGVAEQGQYNAEIYAYPNGAVTQYNWITAKFIYRQTFIWPTGKSKGILTVQPERNTFDICVNYLFVGGEQADYVGLASAYRSYLKDRGMLKTSGKDYNAQVDFFGGDVRETALGTGFVPATTLSQMETVLTGLQKAGVGDMLAVYTGWQPDGIYGRYRDGLTLESGLGGKNQLEALARRLSESGTSLMMYTDPVNAYTRSGYAADSFVRGLNGRTLDLGGSRLHRNTYRYLPVRTTDILASQYDAALELGLAGLALDGISNTLTSFLQDSVLISRRKAAIHYTRKLEKMSGLSLAMHTPFDDMWAYCDAYLSFPLYDSGYKFVSRSVPFLAMVLSGSMNLFGTYVNYEANREEFLLRLAESGAAPSFLLTYEKPSVLINTDSRYLSSSYYKDYSNLIVRAVENYRMLTEKTGRSEITGHHAEGNITVTEYANGCRVYVNYSAEPGEADGAVVDGMSFEIREGDIN